MTWFTKTGALALVGALTLSAGTAMAQGSGSAALDAIKTRGQLLCGIAQSKFARRR